MPPNKQPIVSLRAIERVFHADEMDTYALSDVNLDILQGEFVAVTGPSGCGKTTLLSILGLLDAPSSGTYLFDGSPVIALGATERATLRNRKIGFIFQAFNLIGDMTVLENVMVPLNYRGDIERAECLHRARAALERVAMLHRQKHFPSQLSGGQQQRVAVARALAGGPTILLADEPTGNLDSANRATIMQLLRELHTAGVTICMVTHDVEHASAADRQIRLHDGQIVSEVAR